MAAPTLDSTRSRLKALGQEHLLHFAPTLGPSSLRALLDQIAALPIEPIRDPATDAQEAQATLSALDAALKPAPAAR